jgi:hypothetical protein
MNYLMKMGILGILWVNGIIGYNKKTTTGLNQELITNNLYFFFTYQDYNEGRVYKDNYPT